MKKRHHVFAALAMIAIMLSVFTGCGQTWVCDNCGKSFHGTAYTGWNGDETLCEDCATEYWWPLPIENFEKGSSNPGAVSAEEEYYLENEQQYVENDREDYEQWNEAPEEVFVPDYAPGMALTMSSLSLNRSDWELASSSGYSNLVRQDQMLYFTSPYGSTYRGSLCKIPVGGSVEDVVMILPDIGIVSDSVVEMQVVGDWIYLLCNPAPSERDVPMSLYRVRTDGGVIQFLTNDILNEAFNTFIVRDDSVYYTVWQKDQVSASNYYDICEFRKLQLSENGGEGYDTLIKIEDGVDDVRIAAYNDNRALLASEEGVLVFDLETEEIIPITDALNDKAADYSNTIQFFPGADGEFLFYLKGPGTIYRCSPDNDYEPELYLELSITGNAYEGPTTSNVAEFMVLDDGRILTNCAANIREKRSLWLFENGVRTLIVEDYGANLSYPGDGYLYYSYCSDGSEYPEYDCLCRIRLDGSGWESLNYGS